MSFILFSILISSSSISSAFQVGRSTSISNLCASPLFRKDAINSPFSGFPQTTGTSNGTRNILGRGRNVSNQQRLSLHQSKSFLLMTTNPEDNEEQSVDSSSSLEDMSLKGDGVINKDDSSNNFAKTTDTSSSFSSPSTSSKENNGFVNALILGPPLVIKFAIVLLVKFISDLIVFPLLFMLRVLKLAQVKVFRFFSRFSGGGDNAINGAIGIDSTTIQSQGSSEDLDTTSSTVDAKINGDSH